jgi:prevent-host-death family protein
LIRESISKVKASFSEYLNRVKAGEELVITERGRSIARIVSLEGEENDSSNLLRLEKEGLLARGREKLPDDFWEHSRPRVRSSAVSALLKNRQEER